MPKRINTQTPESKFSGILRHLNVPPPSTAKSKDPGYQKLTVYIRKEVHLAAKRKLLDQGGGELSALVEELLADWLKAS